MTPPSRLRSLTLRPASRSQAGRDCSAKEGRPATELPIRLTFRDAEARCSGEALLLALQRPAPNQAQHSMWAVAATA